MATQPTREAERSGETPVGTVNVVDPHPLNWLYITRAGTPVEKFEELMGEFAVENDANRQGELSAEIDRLVYDEALSVFLVYPQALYAVNKHVDFVGYATAFELAETSVTEEHWSRRNGA